MHKSAVVFYIVLQKMGMAKQALDLGFYISISGIITFKNAQELRDVVRQVPLERLLVETDSPCAASPYRGKQNQPAYTREVCEYVATLKGLSAEDFALVLRKILSVYLRLMYNKATIYRGSYL